MKTALLLIATGEEYRRYAKMLIASADEFFVPHDVVLFTDEEDTFPSSSRTFVMYQENLGYPKTTLMRYHIFLKFRSLLAEYDNLFYSDVDMRFVAPISEEEIFSDGITATLHPGYVGRLDSAELELNPESAAYCPRPRNYFCGGFNGGTSQAYLRMAETIRDGVDRDTEKGIVARWHDESHLNRYLFDHPPARILSPSFCCPEESDGFYKETWASAGVEVTPKLLALWKGRQ